jgi:ABC-type Fe3+ transport system permease subunit
MNLTKRILAATELLLVLPATLFMTALFVRNLQPAQYEPARSAGRLVEWFSARPFLCLGIFLIALPLAVFIVGCVTLVLGWHREEKLRQAALETLSAVRAHLTTLIIAGATAVAAGILAIVAVHVITD